MKFKNGGDKFSDAWRRPFFLTSKSIDFFTTGFFCGQQNLQRDGHFHREKQYFLSFAVFSCPQKSSKIVSVVGEHFGGVESCHAENPVVNFIFFLCFSESFFTTEIMEFTTDFFPATLKSRSCHASKSVVNSCIFSTVLAPCRI